MSDKTREKTKTLKKTAADASKSIRITCEAASLVEPGKLIPFQGELKTLETNEYEKLKCSIERHGFSFPVFVWRDPGRKLQVIDGHQRLNVIAQMLKDGFQLEGGRLPVSFIDAASKKEAKEKVLIAASQYGRYTEDSVYEFVHTEGLRWEDLKLEIDLPQLNMGKLSVGYFGELGVGIDPREDEIPELPKRSKIKLGQRFTLGDSLLVCGDSTDTKAVDEAFALHGAKAFLMNTDPPYGVNYSKTKDGIPRSGFVDHQKKWGDLKGDELGGAELQAFLERAFRAALPNLYKAGWYLWHAHLTQGFFAAAAAAADVLLHRQIIWKKPGFVLTRSGQYHWAHEPCFYGWVRGQQPRWFGNKSQTTVWEVGRDSDSGQHPTQKPVALFTIPLLNHTEPGDWCYEPFAGSGSQLIAAHKLERRCIAFEIEPRWCDLIIMRWEAYSAKKAERLVAT